MGTNIIETLEKLLQDNIRYCRIDDIDKRMTAITRQKLNITPGTLRSWIKTGEYKKKSPEIKKIILEVQIEIMKAKNEPRNKQIEESLFVIKKTTELSEEQIDKAITKFQVFNSNN